MADTLSDLALEGCSDAAALEEILHAWELLVDAWESDESRVAATVSPTATLLDWNSSGGNGSATSQAFPPDPAPGSNTGTGSDSVFWFSNSTFDPEMLDVAAAVKTTTRADDGECLLTADCNLQEANKHIAGAGGPTPPITAGTQNIDEALDGCEPNTIRAFDDMYTPRWIRGVGKEKEGLCPVCFEKGTLNWRRMKCSAYWYHLNYFHGISSLTGRPFPQPKATRSVCGAMGRVRTQGLCGICGRWVFTDSSRRISINVPEIYWWKHIQACIKRTWAS